MAPPVYCSFIVNNQTLPINCGMLADHNKNCDLLLVQKTSLVEQTPSSKSWSLSLERPFQPRTEKERQMYHDMSSLM